MRVFVAGATGALGRNLLPRLVAAGHQVVGTTRTEERAHLIRQLGGEALVADGLDPKRCGVPCSPPSRTQSFMR